MTYQLSVLTERLRFLQSELGDHIKVLSTEDVSFGGFSQVEITIKSEADVLGVFHAGIRANNNY
jgi:hypothetical protein